MKTAMQELIDELKAISTAVSKEKNLDMVAAFNYAIDVARLSIEKEKEQIIEAANYGLEHFGEIAEKYYNEKYNK